MGEYSSSGGFVEFVFRYAARELFGVTVPPGPLQYVPGRNADYREVLLQVDGNVVLRFAQAYGFRNIQAVIQKVRPCHTATPWTPSHSLTRPLCVQVKRGRCPLQLVEVMACPSGCLNGGGQVKGPVAEPPAQSKERLSRVKEAFLQDRAVRDPLTESPVVRWAYRYSHSPLASTLTSWCICVCWCIICSLTHVSMLSWAVLRVR